MPDIAIGCSRRNARIAAPTGWCVPTQHRMSVAIGEATDKGTRLKARVVDVPELVKVGGNHGATAASRQAHAELHSRWSVAGEDRISNHTGSVTSPRPHEALAGSESTHGLNTRARTCS